MYYEIYQWKGKADAVYYSVNYFRKAKDMVVDEERLFNIMNY